MWAGFIIRIVIHSKTLEDRTSSGGLRKGAIEHTVVKMRVNEVFELLLPVYKMRVMSYITESINKEEQDRQGNQQQSKAKIPRKYARYNVLLLHGAKPKLSREQEEYVAENKEDFTQGWYYGRRTRKLIYDPMQIPDDLGETFHVPV